MRTDSDELELIGKVRSAQRRQQVQPRAVGSPLPMGAERGRISPSISRPPQDLAPPQREVGTEQEREVRREAGLAVTTSTSSKESNPAARGQRAMNVLRMAVPLVQRILPLLDGNVGTAISNLMAPQQRTHAPNSPAVDVNLDHIEHGLTELEAQHRDMTVQNRELREQMVEQSTSMKRMEHQLEMVREATDRNTLEQQELLEDFKHLGSKVNLVAIFALALLAASVVLNVFLYLHIQRVLP
jgi:hypothetical protein